MMHRSEDELTVDNPSSCSLDGYVEPPTLADIAPGASTALDYVKRQGWQGHPTWEGPGGRTNQESTLDRIGSTKEVFEKFMKDRPATTRKLGATWDGPGGRSDSSFTGENIGTTEEVFDQVLGKHAQNNSPSGWCACNVTNDKDCKVGDLPNGACQLPTASRSFMFTTVWMVDRYDSQGSPLKNSPTAMYRSEEPVEVHYLIGLSKRMELLNRAGDVVAVFATGSWDMITRSHAK